MRPSRLRDWAYSQKPEYLLYLAVFAVMFGMMATACIFRVLGVGWFRVDYSSIVSPPVWVQEVTKFVLFWFEICILTKTVCAISWGKCLIYSLALSALNPILCYTVGSSYFVALTFVYYFLVPVLLLPDKSKANIQHSLLRSGFVVAVTVIYGMLTSYGRYELTRSSSANYIYGILSAIDYKLLSVNLYLYSKLKGGEKNGVVSFWNLRQ